MASRPAKRCMAPMALASSSCVCSCPAATSPGGRYPNLLSHSWGRKQREGEVGLSLAQPSPPSVPKTSLTPS